MKRRNFIKNASLAATGGLLIGNSAWANLNQNRPSLIKPAGLKKGDTIGLITPASAVSRSAFEKALNNLQELGFNVVYSENMRVRKGFLAGTDDQRLEDLHKMFEDPNIKGIICARGGYGSGRLLSSINYDLIRANPKVFVGFSDITALLYAIHKMTGLVCFHGPVGASEYSDFTLKSFEKVLMKGKSGFEVTRPKKWKDIEDPVFDSFSVKDGKAKGQLVGGNLSLMTSLLGTPYDIDFKGKIVFIEEIAESPYRLDRMLTHMLNSGKLAQANGLALGVFKGCETKPDDPDYGLSLSLKEILMDRLSGLRIPVSYGLPIGHIDDNATLPFGIQAELDSQDGKLTLLESAVI